MTPQDYVEDALLKEFLAEAEEHFQVLGHDLLEMENALADGTAPDGRLIEEMFRATHTLKGLSAMFDLLHVKELAHRAENVFDLLRQGELRPDQDVLDLLFETTAVLQRVTLGLRDGLDTGVEEARLAVLAVDAFLEGGIDSHGVLPSMRSEVFGEYTELRLREGAAEGLQPLRLYLRWGIELRRGGLRRSDVEAAVGGEVLEVRPLVEEVPSLAELDPDTADVAFEVICLASRTPQEVSDALGLSLSAIEKLAVEATTVELQDGETRAEEPKSEVRRAAAVGQIVRVDIGRLDDLMDLTGELVTSRTRLKELSAMLQEAHPKDETAESMAASLKELAGLVDQLQEGVMRMRMVPVGQLFAKFPRAVRDIAKAQGKEIRVEILGGETELDKRLIEQIEEPVLHMLRNACDHGVEAPFDREAAGKPRTGTLRLSASQEGSHIVVEVADDGRGIDLGAIAEKCGFSSADELGADRLVEVLCRPGFSTAERVTDVSGRGVGMDIANKRVTDLGGRIQIESSAGCGTTFRIRVPLTLAIVSALLVGVEGRRFAVPLAAVSEVLRVFSGDVGNVNGRLVLDRRGQTLPLVHVGKLLDFGDGALQQKCFVVEVASAGQRLGLVVDRLVAQQEIVVKNLETALGETAGVSGATILGDGSVVPILDVDGIVRMTRDMTYVS